VKLAILEGLTESGMASHRFVICCIKGFLEVDLFLKLFIKRQH